MRRSARPFAEYRGTSPVFDVAITPNRPDCMGVYGIARDLAAAGLGTFKPLRVHTIAGDFPARWKFAPTIPKAARPSTAASFAG